MGSLVRIRLFGILHFMIDLLFPLLKNSKSGSHMVGTASLAPRWSAPLRDYPGTTPGWAWVNSLYCGAECAILRVSLTRKMTFWN